MPSPARKRVLIAVASILIVIALVLAGQATVRYLGDGDLRAALSSSSNDFNTVVNTLAASTNLEQASAAIGRADGAADEISAATDRLGAGESPKETSVRAEMEAEQAVLVVLGRLDGLSSAPLKSWSSVHDDLTTAITAENDSRAVLRSHFASRAGGLADTGAMLAKLTKVVGPALANDAVKASTSLLTSLQSAKSTHALRTLGDTAAADRAAVAEAATALPPGEDKRVLAGYAAALRALSELSKIDGEHTSGWTGSRAKLALTFGQIAAERGSTGGAGVRVALDSALTSADKLVQSAAAAIADWRAKSAAAIKARNADTKSLAAYASLVRGQTKTYEQLRHDLSAFTARVEDSNVVVTYAEGYDFLAQAMQDRRDVRNLLVGADPPAGVRKAHQRVVAVVDRGIAAVQSAYDGLAQSQDCYYCYYRDTPGWQRFQSESTGISQSYTSAMAKWESAVATSRTAIANRVLPQKPTV
jgi:hypothetical protein